MEGAGQRCSDDDQNSTASTIPSLLSAANVYRVQPGWVQRGEQAQQRIGAALGAQEMNHRNAREFAIAVLLKIAIVAMKCHIREHKCEDLGSTE
jgi:hypothetical protein